MTDLATLLVEDAVNDAKKDERIEIAKNALQEGATIEFICKITGLTPETIEQLQDELNKE